MQTDKLNYEFFNRNTVDVAIVGVVKSGGDLLKSTITNTLARTIKTAKVVKSVVDLGVAIRNSVQKKSLGR